MAENELRPLIIKRKKVIAGGGHHGGAWKVAIQVPFLGSVTASLRRQFDAGPHEVPETRPSDTGTRAFGARHPFGRVRTLSLED
jgi:chemotaxis protein MotB